MGWGFWSFLVEEDDSLLHVPQRVADKLPHGLDRLPRFAGRAMRAVFVALETEGGKPIRIFRVEGSIWHFVFVRSPELPRGGKPHTIDEGELLRMVRVA